MTYLPTPAAAKVLAFLQAYIGQHGFAPSFQEIADHLGGRSKSRVAALVNQLEERGLIQRLPFRNRSLTLTQSSTSPAPPLSGPVFNGVGPFKPGLTRDQQEQQVGSLRLRLARMAWERSHDVALLWLRTLQMDPRAAEGCLQALNELPTTTRRKLLFALLNQTTGGTHVRQD